jgi:transposase
MNHHPIQELQPVSPQPLPLALASNCAAPVMVTLTYEEYIELKWQGQYWKAQHTRAVTREEELKAQLRQKEAIIRDLNQRLYGKKTEKGSAVSESHKPAVEPSSKRPKGQQAGGVGHGRTARPYLPIIHEDVLLDETACPVCRKDYTALSPETSDIMEIQVAAHIRRINRQKFLKNCTCTQGPKIITAPAPLKLLRKSVYANSIWEEILIKKFLYAQPVNRTLNDFRSLGLSISPGTIADNLKKLIPLFEPIYTALRLEQMTENRFHGDETRWEVYQQVEGKIGHRWYLWLIRSASVIYYRMDPTRSAQVPVSHFADLIAKTIILICDRYGAYKKLAKLNLAILLAFCWAHVRRDFLNVARNHTDLKDWGLDFVEEIGGLFHLNNVRIAAWDKALSIESQSELFQKHHLALGLGLEALKGRCDALLNEDKIAQQKKGKSRGTLCVEQRKVLKSLQNHWSGLIVFYEHPEVKMDNNPAEESLRNPVLGRKAYYGSGSLDSAELAAMLFSIFQTLLLWGLNPRTWLRDYLEVCRQNTGVAPEDVSAFLPWKMTLAQKDKLSKPPDTDTS